MDAQTDARDRLRATWLGLPLFHWILGVGVLFVLGVLYEIVMWRVSGVSITLSSTLWAGAITSLGGFAAIAVYQILRAWHPSRTRTDC